MDSPCEMRNNVIHMLVCMFGHNFFFLSFFWWIFDELILNVIYEMNQNYEKIDKDDTVEC